jgi:hypothetical protein
MNYIEFIGKRVDNNQEVKGYYFQLHGCSYILPRDAETLTDFYRVYNDSIQPTEETKIFIRENN